MASFRLLGGRLCRGLGVTSFVVSQSRPPGSGEGPCDTKGTGTETLSANTSNIVEDKKSGADGGRRTRRGRRTGDHSARASVSAARHWERSRPAQLPVGMIGT